jgi:hypothetical protein
MQVVFNNNYEDQGQRNARVLLSFQVKVDAAGRGDEYLPEKQVHGESKTLMWERWKKGETLPQIARRSTGAVRLRRWRC